MPQSQATRPGDSWAGTARIIYLARRSGSGELVALKVYDRGIYLSYAQRRDELLARLDHPNIVRVLEKGEIEGRLYTALEYVDGSLDKRLRDGPLPVSAAASVARAVVLALQHLRERRIVHINLRPAAILLTSENVPKLLELDNIESVETWDEKRYKSALGSGLGFAAPEELVPTDRCSTNVDVYRVGALLYAMLAGHAPFAGDPPDNHQCGASTTTSRTIQPSVRRCGRDLFEMLGEAA